MLSTDPIDLLLDQDGDLVITGGRLQFSTGLTAVVQGIRIRLLTFRGEWFLDLDHGIPYLENDSVDASEAILGQKFNEAKARAAFRDMILSAPGVVEILGLAVKFNRGTRQLDVAFRVRTEFGDSELETLTV